MIQSRAMLATLSISQWTARKRVAYLRTDYQFDADQVEDMQTENAEQHENEVMV